MKLPQRQVDDPRAQENFELIARAMPGFGATGGGPKSMEVRFGAGTLVFTAGTNSADISVTHGLGRAPLVVVATAFNSPAFGNIPTLNTFSHTTTTFGANGEVKTALTGSINFLWVAIG